jgi:hypothetical protein
MPRCLRSWGVSRAPERTQTDRDEQEGLMNLAVGVCQAVRNPEGHANRENNDQAPPNETRWSKDLLGKQHGRAA